MDLPHSPARLGRLPVTTILVSSIEANVVSNNKNIPFNLELVLDLNTKVDIIKAQTDTSLNIVIRSIFSKADDLLKKKTVKTNSPWKDT